MKRSSTSHTRLQRTTNMAILALMVFVVGVSLRVSAADGTLVSSHSSSAATPRIAATANGSCTVVWKESRNRGEQSPDSKPLVVIMAQRRINNAWSQRQVLSPMRTLVTVRQPAVAMDSAGAPHVVWAAQEDQISYLEYAFAIGSRWVHAERIGEISTERIEHPVLAVRPGGDPEQPADEVFFAWQERRGSDYRIHTLMIDATGETYSQVLAHTHVSSPGDAMREVTYPQLMLLSPVSWSQGPRMAICWYRLHADRTELEMRVWHPARHAWQPFTPPQLDPDALNFLPLVQATPETGPFLIGYRASQTGDRIFFNAGDFPLAWIDNTPQAINRMPRISPPLNDIVGLIWQTESSNGTALKQALLDPKGRIAIRSLANVDTFLAPQADVAISAQSILTVWVAPAKSADKSDERVPAVYFADTPVPQPAWQPINSIKNIAP